MIISCIVPVCITLSLDMPGTEEERKPRNIRPTFTGNTLRRVIMLEYPALGEYYSVWELQRPPSNLKTTNCMESYLKNSNQRALLWAVGPEAYPTTDTIEVSSLKNETLFCAGICPKIGRR